MQGKRPIIHPLSNPGKWEQIFQWQQNGCLLAGTRLKLNWFVGEFFTYFFTCRWGDIHPLGDKPTFTGAVWIFHQSTIMCSTPRLHTPNSSAALIPWCPTSTSHGGTRLATLRTTNRRRVRCWWVSQDQPVNRNRTRSAHGVVDAVSVYRIAPDFRRNSCVEIAWNLK